MNQNNKDPRIKCNRCLSFIHTTEKCWNYFPFLCETDKKFKYQCHCHECLQMICCQFCNYKLDNFEYQNQDRCSIRNNILNICEYCNPDRCTICNEMLYRKKCVWNHSISECKFCKLLIPEYSDICWNEHRESYPICIECNLPENPNNKHYHNGKVCSVCNALLNKNSCIYQCIHGGALCKYCGSEGINDNNICIYCKKEQSGELTKRATK